MTPALSQEAASLPVPEILNRLQANVATYLSSVPSFFCDEHVDSNLFQPIDVKVTTATDSIFHIRRSGQGNATQLIESREIKTVNNKPATGENIAGPAIFHGAFTNGVRIVSTDFAPCYIFNRAADQKAHGVRAIVLDYQVNTQSLLDRSCPPIEGGRIFVDPETFHLLRVEARIPHHEITRGVFGLWTWSIDYTPVLLDKRTFWMPSTIESEAIPDSRRNAWSFAAKYSHYHKLEVTSHIVPDAEDAAPAPPSH
jgi:hypothetical protein